MAEDARVKASLPSVLTAIRLLILTGCRRSEILTLRWEHVDLAGRCLRLPESKTGAKVVHLNAPALEILSNLERDPSGWVLPGHNRGSPLINIQKPWDRLSARATVKLWGASDDLRISWLVAELRRGLKREPTAAECQEAGGEIGITLAPHLLDARIHDLRHSFASVAVAGGLSLPIIGALLGHSQPQTTARYAHLATDPMKAITEKIGAAIAGMMEGRTATVKPIRKR
jgi:integrase